MDRRTIGSGVLFITSIFFASMNAGCGGATCGDGCVDGVACGKVVDVSDDASLTKAAADATAGTCIALAPATYGDVTLPGGVSLLGGGETDATVGAVTVLAGSNTVIRGMHVAGIVRLEPNVVDADLENLLVTSSLNGVQAASGVSFTLGGSTIQGGPANGVLAIDATRVTITNTTVVDTKGPGLWVQCTAGCDCAHPSELALTGVILQHTGAAGAELFGATATVNGLQILDPQEGPNFEQASGLSVAACSKLTGTTLKIDGAGSYGMLADNSSVKLGKGGEENGIVIVNSKGGGFITQNMTAGQTVDLENATLTGNSGFGVDLGGGSRGIVIVNSHVGDTSAIGVLTQSWTKEMVSPGVYQDVLVPGMPSTIGYGLVWESGVAAEISSLAVSGSAGNAFLIDGPAAAGSSVDNVTLSGSDASKGIVQQHVMNAADAPMSMGSPSVMQTVTAPFATPAPLAPPVAIMP